jgi:hypothetical protein
MAKTVSVIVSALDRARLEVIAKDGYQPKKHLQRAQMVLASAQRDPVYRVALRLGVSQQMVWCWELRFAQGGVDSILRDKARKPGKARIAAETIARVLAMTCADPLPGARRRSGRAVAKAVGISLRSVQRIHGAHSLSHSG